MMKGGTGHFIVQRVTALANIPLVTAFIIIAAGMSGLSYDAASAVFKNPLTAGLVGLFIVSTAIHMRAGMQVIVEDYVHGEGMKIALLVANTFFCISVAFVAIFATLKLYFGG